MVMKTTIKQAKDHLNQINVQVVKSPFYNYVMEQALCKA